MAFSCLGLEVRIKKGYQVPINFSLLWLVNPYLTILVNYLNIIIKSYFVLIKQLSSKKLKTDLKLKGPYFKRNLDHIANKVLLPMTLQICFTIMCHHKWNTD